MSILINVLLFLSSTFLILLVLVQRGRGGGLAGALGGMGGQSAFGTKAGDVFTKVTIGTAAIWILLCAAAVVYFTPQAESNPFAGVQGAAQPQQQPQAGPPSQGVPPAEGAAPAPQAPASTGAETPAATPPAATPPTATSTSTGGSGT